MNRALVQKLESWQRAGITHLPKFEEQPSDPKRAIREIPASPAGPSSTINRGHVSGDSESRAAKTASSAVDTLDILQADVATCRRCAELACSRTQTVFAVGNPRARLLFLGEAPGADEDAQGQPFVGRAGQLLTKIIEACTLKREDVYIMNVLKCRPPGNRNPSPDEAGNCREFLDRQLALVRPDFICCLGAVAARNLLNTEAPIGRLRGKFFDYQGIQVVCTYHPAYLLRNPAAKKDVWEDMKMLMRRLDVEL